MEKNEILQALEDGYDEFLSNNIKEASKIWLPAWKAAQEIIIREDYKTEKEITNLFGYNFVNWFFDLDIALAESDMHKERLDFNLYILKISDYMNLGSARANVAESLTALDCYDEAESMLSKWLEDEPLWTEGWTSWAFILLEREDKNKAKEIIDRGMMAVESATDASELEFFYNNAEIIYSRVGATKKADDCARKIRELTTKTMLTSTKVGRNEPCPCGSGKKYKVCCGR